METQILPVYEENPHQRHIQKAAEVLGRGGIVLTPTETGYCFLGDARLESTHKSFLTLRQALPNRKPFSLLCRDLSQVGRCAVLPTSVFRIATRAFPGPYTFILDANRYTPKFAAGKRKTVGIRISSHSVPQALLEEFGEPLLITSVTDAKELDNGTYFGDSQEEVDAWWTSAESICEHFAHGIDLALSNNYAVPMRESTIIDFSVAPASLVRNGGWGLDVIGLI